MGFAPKRTVASMAYGWLIFETFASSGRNQNGFSKALFCTSLLASYGAPSQREPRLLQGEHSADRLYQLARQLSARPGPPTLNSRLGAAPPAPRWRQGLWVAPGSPPIPAVVRRALILRGKRRLIPLGLAASKTLASQVRGARGTGAPRDVSSLSLRLEIAHAPLVRRRRFAGAERGLRCAPDAIAATNKR